MPLNTRPLEHPDGGIRSDYTCDPAVNLIEINQPLKPY
jgi:hypothetical protein